MITLNVSFLKAALLFASDEETRYYLKGIHLLRRGDHLRITATDGHRLFCAAQVLDEPEALLDAAMVFIGQTPAPLVLLPLEDAMASDQQPNLPGPGDLHPNWRRRWAVDAGAMLERPRVNHRLFGLAQARRSAEDSSHD